MSRSKVAAAFSGLLGMVAAAIIAVPAQAAPTTITIDFEDQTLGTWSQNDSPTLAYVPDPDDSENTVLSVSGRANGWDGIQSATGVFNEGVEYTISARVRTEGVSENAHFTYNEPSAGEPYVWVGTTPTGTAGEWVTVSGSFIPGSNAENAKVYFEVEGLLDYLIDDITISYEEAEPCVPEPTTHTTVDFGDSTLGTWSQNDSPTLAYVPDPDDSENTVLSVSGRANGWDGIQSATGVFNEGVEYTISARVRTEGVSENAHFTYNEPSAGEPYVWVGTTPTGTAGEWVTVSGSFIPGSNAENAKVYFEVEGLLDYLIDDITITYMSSCSTGPEPGTVVLSTGFEEGLDGWVKREPTDSFSLTRTTADKHGGDYSALVSERVHQGNGIGYDVTELLVPGAQYEFTAWVRLANNSSDELWVSMRATTGANQTFTQPGQFSGLGGGEWKQITTKFYAPVADELFLYIETPYENGDAGDTTDFYVDDISLVVPEPPVVQDLTPIKDTLPFPVGVAIDQRETVGAPSQVLLKHFNQITPENFMKPEGWYDTNGNWSPNQNEIDSLMDFAKANDVRLYGHVLVWHSQTPAWFFQDENGNPLTTSEQDKQFLRDRLRTHINNVVDYLAQWGEYGGDNPVVAFDVVNEVIDDSASYADGMRRSEWYRILGEEFVSLAFQYAEEAFNQGDHVAEGADRPVKLFINDYNTEMSGKRARYLALIDRLLAADVPVDGIGHQFHVSLSMPISALEDALSDASSRNLLQAVTEFDVTTGTPESQAKFIDQGYYYRDAFEVFRSYEEQMFSVTVWGLNDARSWRDSSGGPLIFDDGFQAKPAYYGIVEPSGEEDPLPARLRTANSFAGDVPATAEGIDSPQWDRLPLLPAGSSAGFQTRWTSDGLTVYVEVEDATTTADDAVTVQLGDDEYTLTRAGAGDGAIVEGDAGYQAILQVPLSGAAIGNTLQLDVRVSNEGNVDGWNTPGVLGTVTLVEELSHVNVPEAAIAPVIDGTLDDVWSTSSQIQTLKEISGTNGAIGTFHLLWKDQTLYVYAEVADPTVDVSGSDPWIQDSVEIYVDAANSKNGSYRYDDTQIRINADNVASFGTGDEGFQAARLQSQTKRVTGGYVVEAAISLLEYGGLGTVQGLDVQVNDATGGTRTAIRNWADPTGAGYQSSARWGVATLVEGSLIAQTFTPKVSGSAVVGKTLSVTGLPTGATLSYQWLRNGVAISGATNATYKLVAADAGKQISVRVTSVRDGYLDATKTSAQTAKVLKTFTKTSAPKITGSVKVGKKLTAKVSAWSPAAKFTYQWYSNGKKIKGATKSTFTVKKAQAGTKITVMVTGSRSGYQSVSKLSAAKKVPLLKFTVKKSKLSGPTKVGGTLKVTAGTSSVKTTKSYQWYVNGKKIKGATKSTYTVKAADKGKRITVKVTYKAKYYATKTATVGPTFQIRAR